MHIDNLLGCLKEKKTIVKQLWYYNGQREITKTFINVSFTDNFVTLKTISRYLNASTLTLIRQYVHEYFDFWIHCM